MKITEDNSSENNSDKSDNKNDTNIVLYNSDSINKNNSK